ncbi:MarR family transcriptional regulator [Sphingomonas sp. H39-1-10]|uniref:MarR family winged helix-turn-helix transcriptional regulator n=1 Tax=Sphingomonas pollutisoli TaxID=3030829 RepID=UPI0023B98A0E|nr:MarR family transcriptional regulator [Sphingomonas pollutisoli]MDF0490690.1 MarR family transcriptional regulator [Sphingomonas pollutisoli]
MARLTIEDCATQRAPGRMLRRLEQDIKTLLERRFAVEDITFTQWIALKVVRDGAISNPGELARELNITTGATTRLIDTLEERGLILRDRNAEDRRVVGLKVTPAGEAMVAKIGQIVVAGWNELIADFEEDEVTQFASMLSRLLVVAERMLGKENTGFAGETGE